MARRTAGNVEDPEVEDEEATVEEEETTEEEDTEETEDEAAEEEDSSNVVASDASKNAQQMAEGRDPADTNELQSFVSPEVTAPVNQSDAVLQGANTAVDVAEFPSLSPTVAPEEELSAADKKRKTRFAKLAQVEADDITAFNTTTLVGVTSAGGKYQMNRKGTQLRHLAGPVPSGVQSDKEKADEERKEREANAEE